MRLQVVPRFAMIAALAACTAEPPETAAVASALTATPHSLEYGEVLVGSTATLSTVVRTNNNETIAVTGVSTCTGVTLRFEVTECVSGRCSSSAPREISRDNPVQLYRTGRLLPLGAFDYATLTVYYTARPTSRGEQACVSEITTSENELAIRLTGTGVAPELTLEQGVSGFANQRINTTSPAMTFRVSNTGDAGYNLTLTGFATLTNSEDWIVTLDTSQPLEPGQSRTGTVAFSPKQAGGRATTLQISSSDPVVATESLSLSGTGTSALVSAPGPVAFASTVINQARTATFSLSNSGTHPLTLSGASIGGNHSADFSLLSATFPTQIAPGASSTFTVQCRPSATGARSAALTIDTDADNAPQDPAIALSCTGTRPDIGVAPTSYGFGNVTPGTTASTTVTVSNAGGGSTVSTLSVGSPTVTGANASEFTVTSGAFTLAPGASRALTVTFTPNGFGPRTATVRLTSDDPETPTVDIPLSGTGFGPEITLLTPNPPSIAFGGVSVGQTSGGTAVSIRNDGNANLNLTAINLSNSSDFVLVDAPTPPVAIAPGAVLSAISVACRPTATGQRTGVITLVSNDASEPNTAITLTCTGMMGNLAVTSPATPVVVPATDVGATSAPVVITVQNTGNAPIMLNAPTISPSVFTISTGLGVTTLAAGATTSLAVRFTPNADGAASGTLTLPYGSAQPLIVGLVGTGRAALVSVSSPTIGFGNVVVNSRATGSVVLRNDGSAALNIQGAAISGGPGPFALVDAAPTSVPADSTRTVELRCAPTAVGARSATLTFDTDADNSPQDPAVTLSCTGVKPDLSLDMNALEFGNVAPSSSEQRMLVISNASATTTSTLSVAAPALSGTHAADYSISPSGAFTLAPGATRTLTVTFRPATLGPRAASLRISSDDQETPTIDLPLSGTGRAQELTLVSPTGPIAFGNVKLSTSSTPTSIQIRNDGNADLIVSGVVSTGTDASQFIVGGPGTPAAIAAGASETWTVACRPSTVGAKAATVNIHSNDTNESTVGLAMTCTGTQANLVMTSPATAPIVFATTRVGERSPEVTVLLVNTGTAPLSVVQLPLVSPRFVITTPFPDDPPFTLGPNQSTSLGLRFAPTMDGTVDGTLRIDWDATSMPIALQGPGTVAIAGITPAPDQGGTIDLGATCVGQPREQPFTIDNDGSGAFAISAIEIAGDGFSLAHEPLPATLTPGQSLGFTVTIDPTAATTIAATVTVTTDVPGMPTRVLELESTGLASGLGVAPVGGAAFGVVDPDSTSTSTAITLTNCDTEELTISAVTLDGADRDEFEVIGGTRPPPAIVIPSAGSSQWLVVYAPDDPGPSAATFHIVHDGSGGMTDVELSGIGSGGTGVDGGIDAGVETDADSDGLGPGLSADGDKSSYYACAAGGGMSAGLGTLALVAIAGGLRRRARR